MRVLVIAPHPDDETLGCGGTLLQHRAQGDVLFWLIATRMTEDVGYTQEQIRVRAEEIRTVAAAYPFEKVFPLDFATTTLDRVPDREFARAVATVVDEVGPTIVYLPNRSDIHTDHRSTFDAAMGALKTFPAPSAKRGPL